MVTVSEATSIILNHLLRTPVVSVDLQGALHRSLAEPVVADRDLPPFNRVAMDGIAINHVEWKKGRRTFVIEGTQAAGEKQRQLAQTSNCFEAMTGAVLPAGCDTVVRYEDLNIESGTATIKVEAIEQWQSIHRQGMDARRGDALLEPGRLLSPSEIALLASVGKDKVSVFVFPRVAIISTGDELVDVKETPEPWQIRRSNSYALQAALRALGVDAFCFHLPDVKTAMREKVAAIVNEFDVLILSGGVSKGKFDFVPEVLGDIGIRPIFHQVSQRPGKPLWFGRSSEGKVAFALPGNPVSTFMCFYRYVRPWIQRSLGLVPRQVFATLARDYAFPPALTCFLQVTLSYEQGRLMAHPVPGGGSGDFANLSKVDGFLELPLEKSDFRAGEVFPCITFRE